ncbi:hypothetical protein Bbelb_187630 [Branchiostoma belcheri]|nr:hypothetical protein Bbelb_187630 [Branchiostoma belcheri]
MKNGGIVFDVTLPEEEETAHTYRQTTSTVKKEWLCMMKALGLLIMLASCFRGGEAQFPRVCTSDSVLRSKECCPTPPGFPGPCGGPGRGYCANIRNTTMDTANWKASDYVDDRSFWPLNFFNRSCVCKDNFSGYDCTKCKWGYRGPNCQKNQETAVRRNIKNLSSDEKQKFKRYLDRAKNTVSDYVFAKEFLDNIKGSEDFVNVSVYDYFVGVHYYASRFTMPPIKTRLCFNWKQCFLDFAHETVAFPTWHRKFLLEMERAVQEVNNDSDWTLPYWDWSAAEDNQCDICTNEYVGANDENGNLDPGSIFAGWWTICEHLPRFIKSIITNHTRPCDVSNNTYWHLKRNPGTADTEQFGESMASLPSAEEVDFAMRFPVFDTPPYSRTSNCSFRNLLEGFADTTTGIIRPDQAFDQSLWSSSVDRLSEAALGLSTEEDQSDWSKALEDEDGNFVAGAHTLHNHVHLYMTGTMQEVASSPNDPIFYLHHCNVDRQLETWMRLYPSTRTLTDIASSTPTRTLPKVRTCTLLSGTGFLPLEAEQAEHGGAVGDVLHGDWWTVCGCLSEKCIKWQQKPARNQSHLRRPTCVEVRLQRARIETEKPRSNTALTTDNIMARGGNDNVPDLPVDEQTLGNVFREICGHRYRETSIILVKDTIPASSCTTTNTKGLSLTPAQWTTLKDLRIYEAVNDITFSALPLTTTVKQHMFNLGNLRYAVVELIDGQPSVGLWQYERRSSDSTTDNDHDLLRTEKGISLTLQQWQAVQGKKKAVDWIMNAVVNGKSPLDSEVLKGIQRRLPGWFVHRLCKDCCEMSAEDIRDTERSRIKGTSAPRRWKRVRKAKRTRDHTESKSIDGIFRDIYYDPRNPAGYGSVDQLYRAVKRYGIKRRQVEEWLRSQDTYTLHKPIRRRFKKNRVIVGGLNNQWQADLADLSSLAKHNDGYRYILTCIDVLSKFAWAVPIKDKKGLTLVQAFQSILDDGRKPRRLQTDQGTEFLNRHFQTLLKKENVEFFTTFNAETKASVVERFNRTLKTRMWKYFTANNTRRYIDVLDDLLEAYNHSYHRSIKRAPVEVTEKNEGLVWHTLYGEGNTSKPLKRRRPFKFKVGDLVRISKSKLRMEKGYTPNWTTEIFTVYEQIARHPPVYRVQDYHGEKLQGTFYEEELQKVIKKDDDVYQVEKILDTRRREAYLVMANSFYVTLPSDGSMDIFPENTVTNYRTKLAHPIELSGEWEVGLVEIQYPHSWRNVREGENTLLSYVVDEKVQGSNREYDIVKIPIGYYENIQHLLKTLNEAASVRYPDVFTQRDMFAYNGITKRVTIVLPPMVTNATTTKTYLVGPLAEKLGWGSKDVIYGSWVQAPRSPDPNLGFHSLYVYGDIVQHRLVGGVKVPLLRIIKIEGQDGDIVDHPIMTPHYIPLARKRFETMEIDIRNDLGAAVPFEQGRLIRGGQLPVYYGRSMQRGYGLGGIFRGLLRSAVPLLKRGAKSVGRHALRSGIDFAQDILNGQDAKRSAKRRGKELGQRLMSGPNQKGGGRRASSKPPAKRAKINGWPQKNKKVLKRRTPLRTVSRKRGTAQRRRTPRDIFD